MKLRLYHHPDGARVAYREVGTGPALVLLHSARLSHREFAPVAADLSRRFRVVLPDLPLHGDSEDRPRHPYTLDWFAEVLAGFCADCAGPRPTVAGHELGAQIILRAVARGLMDPARIALMPAPLHRPPPREPWRAIARAGAVPGLDRVMSHLAKAAMRPDEGVRLSARADPAAGDLVRHAVADVAGNVNLARSWARFAANAPRGPQTELLDLYPRITVPVLLLWADRDRHHPLQGAEEALDLLGDAHLRVLPTTGFLLAYDDPVGVARELTSFCG